LFARLISSFWDEGQRQGTLSWRLINSPKVPSTQANTHTNIRQTKSTGSLSFEF